MPDMKADSERGVTGAWAYRARQELGMSVEQVAEAIAARGHQVSAATIRGVESGTKQPSARLLHQLAAVLGSDPPGTKAQLELADPAVLIDAMTRALLAQTHALTDLQLVVAEARQSAEEQRIETARLIGHLSDQLDELRAQLGMPAASVVPESDDHP